MMVYLDRLSSLLKYKLLQPGIVGYEYASWVN